MKNLIPNLVLDPIGVIRTEMVNKFDAPHQPDTGVCSTSVIDLFPGRDFHKALEDLKGFEYIWLIWWFHKNTTWRPKVRPPRGEGMKRGLFATRSPHRPNPIAISAVRLIDVAGLKLVIGGCDLVDGTPILDIKPYIPKVDSFPDAKIGWLAEVEDFYQKEGKYKVIFSRLALEQKVWLETRGVNFFPRAIQILERDPSINRTRRISRFNDIFKMGCAEWRLFFSVNMNQVEIQGFLPGYPKEKLLLPGADVIVNKDTQLAFYKKFETLNKDKDD